MVLLRFAPSPTGPLHLGGLRTALYNHLYAKKLGGKWILRIEDTDSTRYVPGAVDGIRSGLAWANLEYDYGPGRDGPHGPYFQSERLDLYQFYTRKLLDSGRAYRCFCSPDKLTATREKLARTGSNSTYDKTCLHLTEEEVARRVRAGEKSIVRLNDNNLPPRIPTVDLVFGPLKDAHASLPTDPVLLKSDGFPTYHLASVVDDHTMGITHVLRGEEWLPSLPLHLDLYSCLSLEPPRFAHLPILLNADGTKMSKRKGDVQVADYMRRGWEPDAVLNWLALAGWGVQHEAPLEKDSHAPGKSHSSSLAPDSTKVMNLSELIEEFDISFLTHRRNVLDSSKLEFLNKHHLMRHWESENGVENHAQRIHGQIKTAFPTSPFTTVNYIGEVIRILQGRIVNIQDIPVLAPFFFVDPDYTNDEAQTMLRSITPSDYAGALHAVIRWLQGETNQMHTVDIAEALRAINADVVLKHGAFMTVLRHALTGMKTGPTVPEIIQLLGRERTMGRICKAAQDIESNAK